MARILRLALLAFVTGFSGAVMPGPMLALTIGQTSARGFIAVPLICTGHALLELVTVLLLIAGLRTVVERPAVRAAIGLIGGAALVYLGADMIRSASGLALNLDSNVPQTLSWPKLVLGGAAVCAANPYFLGWWATVGSGQMAHAALRTVDEYLAFYFGHELSDLVWFSLVGLLIVSGRHSLSPEVYRGLVLVCGGVIVVLGIWFIVAGVSILRQRTTARPPIQ